LFGFEQMACFFRIFCFHIKLFLCIDASRRGSTYEVDNAFQHSVSGATVRMMARVVASVTIGIATL
jgi:hypothetical protein